MSIETRNPATGEVIKVYDEMSDETVSKRIDKAHAAFSNWSMLSFSERAKLMQNAAKILHKNKEDYAALMTSEMGQTITEARAEIDKCALICEHNAEMAETYLASREIKTEMTKSMVCYRPQGAIFAIMPWNFPFWQVFRFAAPNLMAGNVGLLSHAPISTGTSLAIETIFKEAGFPEGVFTSLIINNEQAADVIAHPHITAVTLTGSERAGRSVAATAGAHLKKVVLELGGSDPYVILDDADIDNAATLCVKDRMMCTGQVCISAKRLIAVDTVYDAFEKAVMEKMKAYQAGDPMDDQCNFAPMARLDLRDQVAEQVQRSIQAGANCLLGANKIDRAGFYYEPTVLSNVEPGMAAFDEELFGPVVCLTRAKDEADAIKLANQTPFGLGAAVFTNDAARGKKIAVEQLNAGVCAVNYLVASDPRLPFGGIKQSGYGRECSAEGIREFMNTKTINIK